MQTLLKEAIAHRAVNHPYLKALVNGSFENMDAVIKDFANQYGYYSDWFPRYLTCVISKLENPEFRNHLLENLSEESGHLHEEEMGAIRDLGIKDERKQWALRPIMNLKYK